MKTISALSILALTLATGLAASAAQAQVFNSTLGFGGMEEDRGCLYGAQAGSRFPQNVYDPRTHERLLMNISHCTGGFITAVNEDTGAHWNADFFDDGTSRGRDADGHAWRYDPKTHQFLNLATQATCAKTDLRHVCAASH
jgi:hypothetical protein